MRADANRDGQISMSELRDAVGEYLVPFPERRPPIPDELDAPSSAAGGEGGDGRPHLLELRRIQRGVETLGDGVDSTHSAMNEMRARQDEELKALEAQRVALDARLREAEDVIVERDHLLEEVDGLSREKLQPESLLKGRARARPTRRATTRCCAKSRRSTRARCARTRARSWSARWSSSRRSRSCRCRSGPSWSTDAH